MSGRKQKGDIEARFLNLNEQVFKLGFKDLSKYYSEERNKIKEDYKNIDDDEDLFTERMNELLHEMSLKLEIINARPKLKQVKKNTSSSSNKNNVNKPKHYNYGKIEVIDVIDDWKCNFNLGNAIKYIARCEHKNNKEEDLKKAIWYINREVSKI